MDRSHAVLIAGLFGLVALGGAEKASILPHEARWLAPGADIVSALTLEPSECYRPSADPAIRAQEAVGRALFSSPSLLGGQAARAGLSCASCHSSGRSNTQFFFPGVSGSPGSADVSSSVFSEMRGDAKANPVPIPDLAAAPQTLKIARNDRKALEAFLRGLIVEEFAGPEPTPRALQGIAAYVQAITPQACPALPTQPITAARLNAQIRDGVRAADAALAQNDVPLSIALLAAARAALGRLHDRFPAPEDHALRAGLIHASSALALAATSARGEPLQARQQLAVFLARSKTWAEAASAAEPHSLFAPEVITQALESDRS